MAKDTPASVNNSGRERIAAGKQRRLYTLSATTSELSSAFFSTLSHDRQFGHR
jgi:hypothetical protein